MADVEAVMRRIAETIASTRRDSELTQAELGRRAGITVETVARLERVVRDRVSANGNPTLETLIRIAEALGLELSELVADKPTPRGKASPAERAWRSAEAGRLEREAKRLRSIR